MEQNLFQLKHTNTRHNLNYFCPVIKKEINKNVNSYHNFGFSLSSITSELEIIASHMNIIEKFVHKKKKIVGICGIQKGRKVLLF